MWVEKQQSTITAKLKRVAYVNPEYKRTGIFEIILLTFYSTLEKGRKYCFLLIFPQYDVLYLIACATCTGVILKSL